MKAKWRNGDPLGSEREKSTAQRKSGRDPGLTPTEQHRKAQLMRQFLRLDGPKGSTEEYRNSPVWCACGRGMNRRGKRGDTLPCAKCRPDLKAAA